MITIYFAKSINDLLDHILSCHRNVIRISKNDALACTAVQTVRSRVRLKYRDAESLHLNGGGGGAHLCSLQFLMKGLLRRWNQIFCRAFFLRVYWKISKNSSPLGAAACGHEGSDRCTFAEKQRLTNERRWQGGGEVLAERNTFVSLWSSERPVRHREMTSSPPQGALPVLANWQIDQRGQVWFRIASEIKLFWAFVISGIMKFVIKAGYIALVCIRSKTQAAE